MIRNIAKIAFICAFFLSCQVFGFTNDVSSELNQLEMSVFGYQYLTQNQNVRLDRLENEVFGEKSVIGDFNERIERLKRTMGLNSALSIKSETDRVESIDDVKPVLKEELNITYPIVDSLESRVFSRSWQREDIYKRLDRLEDNVFRVRSQQLSLNERIERLKLALLGDNAYVDVISSTDDFVPQSNLAMSHMEQANSVSDVDISQNLNILEKQVFRKNFLNDSDDKRLARLESKIFKRSFETDDDLSRLKRLAAANIATQKKARFFDNNVIMRGLGATAQIGGILLLILAMIL